MLAVFQYTYLETIRKSPIEDHKSKVISSLYFKHNTTYNCNSQLGLAAWGTHGGCREKLGELFSEKIIFVKNDIFQALKLVSSQPSFYQVKVSSGFDLLPLQLLFPLACSQQFLGQVLMEGQVWTLASWAPLLLHREGPESGAGQVGFTGGQVEEGREVCGWLFSTAKLLEAITESSHVTRNLVPGSKNAANSGQKNKPSLAVHPAVGRLLHYRKP